MTSEISTPLELAVGAQFHAQHGTKTTPVFLLADGEASWSLLQRSVSLLPGSTVQPENTNRKRWGARLVDVIKHLPHKVLKYLPHKVLRYYPIPFKVNNSNKEVEESLLMFYKMGEFVEQT